MPRRSTRRRTHVGNYLVLSTRGKNSTPPPTPTTSPPPPASAPPNPSPPIPNFIVPLLTTPYTAARENICPAPDQDPRVVWPPLPAAPPTPTVPPTTEANPTPVALKKKKRKRKPERKNKKHSIWRTNTPVFGTIRFKTDASLQEILFTQVMQYVVGSGGCGLRQVVRAHESGILAPSLVYCYGYLEATEMLVASTLSCQVSKLANKYGWGVDSHLWARRPMYFSNNIDSDGLQWARQIRHVFLEEDERLNWAAQFHARTRGLTGATRYGGTKWCYHRPRCYSCKQKTKCYHVLRLVFQCRTCVNRYVSCMHYILLCHYHL